MIEAAVPSTHHSHSAGVLFRNLAILVGSQLITWLSALVWALFVPRALGPDGTGIFTLSVAASGILTVSIGIGTRPLLVREISVDRSRAGRLIPTAIILRALLAVPMLIVIIDIGIFAPSTTGCPLERI